MRIAPMLAAPMKKGVVTNWTDWAVEEKYDGHRIVVTVERTRTGHLEITAHTRTAESKKDGEPVTRDLPTHIIAELERLPSGIYDGELMGGEVGTDVTRKDLAHQRAFVVFDLLYLFDQAINVTARPYHERRKALVNLFERVKPGPAVRLSVSKQLTSESDLTKFVKRVWDAGGEGAILKRIDSLYYPGARAGVKTCPLVWIKIKRVTHAVLDLVGFAPTKGTVLNRGPFAIMKLRGEHPDPKTWPTCKVRDDQMLADINAAWEKKVGTKPRLGDNDQRHPYVNKRRVVIEFPKRTHAGGYQGPVICDRWAEGDE